jgi:hypothetical protein
VSKKKVVEKYNLDDAEDLCGSVLSEESADNDNDDDDLLDSAIFSVMMRLTMY